MNKLGHQSPKGFRINKCNSIEIDSDLHYCVSHNFMYNEIDETKKLYNGEPCFYTDKRFLESYFNNYGSTNLYFNRKKPISIKSAIRKIKKCRNIPKGTIINLKKSWRYKYKKIDNSFIYKIKKENILDIKYEISDEFFYKNFSKCEFSINLTNKLRENGFIVQVQSNSNNLLDMINYASAITGNDQVQSKEDGEIAIAYGYGKKIGYSSFNNNFLGYSIGKNNILFDCYGYFNKWSRCIEIPKESSIEYIVNELKRPNIDFYTDYNY